MERYLAIVLILQFFGQIRVWAKTETVYYVASKTLELRPPPNVGTITSIVWRDSKGFVAEWREGDATVTIYQNYKDRATLNTTTGCIEIKNMAANGTVEYTVEINDVLQDNKYVATAIEEVPNPSVWVRPEGDNFKLTCDGNVSKAGPVTFWWDLKEDGEWVELGKTVPIQKNESTQNLKMFSCKMKNPVSEKESKPVDNPFFKSQEQETGNAGAIIGVSVVIVLLAGVVAFGVWKRDILKEKCGLGSTGAAGNSVAVSSSNADVAVPLNQKEGTGG